MRVGADFKPVLAGAGVTSATAFSGRYINEVIQRTCTAVYKAYDMDYPCGTFKKIN